MAPSNERPVQGGPDSPSSSEPPRCSWGSEPTMPMDASKGRRALLQGGAAFAITSLVNPAHADDEAAKRPEVGDFLVSMADSDSHKPLAAADIEVNQDPVLAW